MEDIGEGARALSVGSDPDALAVEEPAGGREVDPPIENDDMATASLNSRPLEPRQRLAARSIACALGAYCDFQRCAVPADSARQRRVA